MSEIQTSVLFSRESMLYNGEIYTTSKNFTVSPAVTGGTNITSDTRKFRPFPRPQNRHLWALVAEKKVLNHFN